MSEQEEIKREFKGIFIPAAIWLDKKIDFRDKFLLAEIYNFEKGEKGECFASNAYFAEFLDLSVNRASAVISELTKKGYLHSEIYYKGTTKEVMKRVLSVNKRKFFGIE